MQDLLQNVNKENIAMPYVLGCDLGTSYFKVSLVDEHGNCVGSGRVRTPKRQEGSEVLVHPEAFWEALRTCFSQAVEEGGIDLREIDALSYGSQATSFILADGDGKPVSDLYLWPSVFTSKPDPAYLELRERDDYLDVTGIGPAGRGGMVTILSWFRKHRPELMKRASRLMTISDYFLFGLTGNSFADTSTSSLISMVDVKRQCWWDPALQAVGLSREFFSPLAAPGTYAGETSANFSEKTGLPGGINVYVGGLDHIVAALGAGIGFLADAAQSTGTVLACVGLHDSYRPSPHAFIGDYVIPGVYANLTFESPGAEVIEWYRDAHLPDLGIDDMLDLALEVPLGCNGVRYRPDEGPLSFSGGAGTADHPVYIRAMCEYLAGRVGGLLEKVSAGSMIEGVLATGKANQSNALRQIQAQVIKKRVYRSSQRENGTFGAALIAAAGSGWFSGYQEALTAWIKQESVFSP